MEEKKCSNPACNGKIDINEVIKICPGFNSAFIPTRACSVCGLLHKIKDDTVITYREKEKMFLINDRVIAGGKDITIYLIC